MMEKQIYDPRRAGLVPRYHAQIHLANQSVAEHTWQVLRIVTTVWPEVPAEVLKQIIYHDIAEGVTGDLPYPTKLSDLKLKRLMDEAEHRAIDEMTRVWDINKIPELDAETKIIVKACELVEMWEWALYEKNLGNKYAEIVAKRLEPRIKDTVFKDESLTKRYHEYVYKRREYENEF